ncbi:hypothetical protein L1887_33287 [Cichorium endivia]|nr:hypothetical protein L1887_33287 [Cichorium endivia]
MIASEKRVSLFGNNVDRIDASFSSYMNDNPTVLKLTIPNQINTKKKVEDGEIGIFGAEKYFKGAMDEQLPRTPQTINPTNRHPPKEDQIPKHEEPPKPKTASATPSVRSESSWNSRSGLLVNNGNRRIRKEKTNGVKSLLASLGCNCNDKASVKIVENTENRVLVKELAKPPANTKFAGGFSDDKKNTNKEDCFAFPVLNAFQATKTGVPIEEEREITHVKTRRNSLEAFGSPVLEKGKKSFSLERKLTMLNWDGVTPRAENIGDNNDAASDASSDLFEIESFSTNGNNSFLARQVSNGRSSNATLPNGYAPSEASIAWSVVTASVAGFSIISDYEDTRTSKTLNMDRVIKGSGILSGCTNHKSVRVAGERVVSGGEKAAGTGGAGAKERCRLDSVVPIMKFQADTKSPRTSHHLYIQKQ